MPLNGNTFTRLYSWVAEAASSIKIRADLMDLDSNDIAGGISAVATAINNFIQNVATSAGASLMGYLQSGTGAVSRTVQARLRDLISIKDFSAVGDGVSSDAAAFALTEATSTASANFLLPDGTYVLGSNTPIKNYRGSGVIKLANGRALPGTMSSELQSRYLDPMHKANAVAPAAPRYLVFVGDSISYGFGVTEPQSYATVIQALLNQRGPDVNTDRVSGGILDRATLGGSTAFGTAGPVKRSLIMQVGATATFTVANLDYLGIWFQRAVGAGTITATVGGVTIATFNCSGAAANDSFLQSAFSRFATATVVLTCSVAVVELTGIFTAHTLKSGQIAVMNQSASGYSTADFTPAAVTTSIGAQTPNVGSFYPIYVIGLGTNDIYNVSKAVTSAAFKANLDTIATALRVFGIVVLTVPLRAVQTTYSPVLEPFDNYRNAVFEVARKYGFYVVDLSQHDLSSTNGYQADGLHPNQLGHQLLASIYMQELELASQTFAMPTGTLAPSGAYTAIGGTTYEQPSYDITAGGIVSLSGVFLTNASAKGTTITTLPSDACPAKQRIFVCSGLNAAAGASVTLVITTAGVVTLFDYSSAALTHVCLDGVSFLSRR